MKAFLLPFREPAKVLLTAAGAVAVATGYYDEATVTLIGGLVVAAGGAFWTLYDAVTK